MRILVAHPIRIVRIALTKLADSVDGCHVVNSFASIDSTVQYLEGSEEAIDLILIDSSIASPGSITRLVGATLAKVIVLSNDENSLNIDGWVKEGVRGVLGPTADEQHFEKALLKVCEGEYWLNRDVTSRILSGIGHAQEQSAEQALIGLLTAKEKLVVKALVNGEGQTLRATAQQLNISENTVRNHLTSIYSKLGIANRLELFVFAQRFMAD